MKIMRNLPPRPGESLQDYNNRKVNHRRKERKDRIAFIKNRDKESQHVKDEKHQRFYCTVCKMKTWTFHSHSGQNVSTTKRKVVNPTDITNNL